MKLFLADTSLLGHVYLEYSYEQGTTTRKTRILKAFLQYKIVNTISTY